MSALEAEGLRLRPATPADLAYLVGLAAEPDVAPFLAAVSPWDEDETRAAIEAQAAAPADQGRLVVEQHGADGWRPVGALAFSVQNRRSRIAQLHGVMVDPAARGRGLAERATRMLAEHLVRELDYHRVQLEVYGYNERALRLFERAGFVREGTKRKAYWRDGSWHDGVTFGLVAEDLEREATPTVCVVGSVNLDLVVASARLPQPGETIAGRSLERIPGGKGANQAVAAARLGARTALVAAVGGDEHAELALGCLREAEVDLTALKRTGAPTGVAVVVTADDGENQIVVVPGANALLEPDDVVVGGAGAVLCQLEVPVATVARAAEEAQGLFVLNAAPAVPVPAAVAERADLVVVNEREFELLDDAARGKRVVVTLGARGAVLLEGGSERAAAAPPAVTAADSTGAGDAFTACLVVSLLEGRTDAEALARACAAGALAASRVGAQPSLPTAAEVDALVEASRTAGR